MITSSKNSIDPNKLNFIMNNLYNDFNQIKYKIKKYPLAIQYF